MMKRVIPCLLVFCCMSIALAGYTDGYITAGEYEGAATWYSFNPPLIVDGGGASRISIRDSGRLIVESTSTPLKNLVGGIYDIVLYDTSQLLFSGGLTELITIRTDTATTVLKGGTINLIKSMQYVTTDNIFIYAQDDWSWISGDPLIGIQGKWLDGSPFSIEFIYATGYQPVWQNIKVIPEPATLILLGCGVLLLRKRYVSKFVSQKKETAIKGIFPVLLMCLCVSVSLAGYSDGVITEGEYEYMAEVFYDDVLIVEGGGADIIYMWGNSQLEVRYTSTPLSDNSGIQEIRLCANSRLDYHGGVTDKILLRDNSTAYLYGGQINGSSG